MYVQSLPETTQKTIQERINFLFTLILSISYLDIYFAHPILRLSSFSFFNRFFTNLLLFFQIFNILVEEDQIKIFLLIIL